MAEAVTLPVEALLARLGSAPGGLTTAEARADAAASALKALVRVTTCVTRDGTPRELPVREVVPGDVITLQAGDMIPADLRLLEARGLHVGEASLTGESLPVEKSAAVPAPDGAPLPGPLPGPLHSPVLLFRGTSVQSGTATAVAVATGPATYLGPMIGSLEAPEPPNESSGGSTASPG